MEIIPSPLFYPENIHVYPPFKEGLYMEEYFLKFMKDNKYKYDLDGRLYIPALWTNFQIIHWFDSRKDEMQQILDEYIERNKCENGYFTVVQHDDGPKLRIPENTIVYGACTGTIPLPLIYQDISNKLDKYPKFEFSDKRLLCSFIGTETHRVRKHMVGVYGNNNNFYMITSNDWTPDVAIKSQENYINTSIVSKFALAPRGYGRSSFRFFELFKLGCIPIYIWDDKEWIPYKEILDYSKFCISINSRDMDKIEQIILDIDEEKYNKMWEEYEKIKHMFSLDYMCKYVIANKTIINS